MKRGLKKIREKKANIKDRQRRSSIQVIGVPGGKKGGRDKKTTNTTN